MPLLSARDRRTAEAIAGIGYCNPFLEERVQLERKALGPDFVDHPRVVHLRPGLRPEELFPNYPALRERAEALAATMRARLGAGEPASRSDLILYEELVLYLLYCRYLSNLDGIVTQSLRGTTSGARIEFWRQFVDEFQYFLRLPGRTLPSRYEPPVVFAGCFQIQRAFTHIFDCIIGGSMSAARLRAAVWQSIFTHDMRRYARGLYRHMGDISTLVSGPSGTGKELVARAIGLSRYVAFDPKLEQFVGDYADSFRPMNLSALAPTLIESELFGHKKGAFTGATRDRAGWLEKCLPHGTVFLDEIGELDPSIQVKLLRVLESRVFQRVGESEPPRHFRGKLIAATNRDLALEMRERRFREDLYWRLCADMVTTPSLRQQLAEAPDDLPNLVRFIATRRILPEHGEEAERLASEVVRWIEENLGSDYAWPGNIRELEQCVRNVMIRRTYQPPTRAAGETAAQSRQAFAEAAAMGSFTSDELLRRYYSLVYLEAGSYKAAAEKLQVDWRTVRKKVAPDLLEKDRAGQQASLSSRRRRLPR